MLEDKSKNNSETQVENLPKPDEEHKLLKKNVILIALILIVVIGVLLFAYLHGLKIISRL